MVDFPYKPSGGCDLCGRQAPLSRVTLADGGRRKLARALWVCDAHPDCSGEPMQAPSASMLPGTHRLAPQGETLF